MSGDLVTPPGYAVRHARMVGWRSRRQHLALGVDSPRAQVKIIPRLSLS